MFEIKGSSNKQQNQQIMVRINGNELPYINSRYYLLLGKDVIFAQMINLQNLFILMECCSDVTVVKDSQWREGIRQTKLPEPIKFKVLSMLGLKQYLIGKYVFMRNDPQYSITKVDGINKITAQQPIFYPQQYDHLVFVVKDSAHNIPTVKLSLKNRDKYCATVIYSHGNSSDILNSLHFITKVAKNYPKFDYIVYDYTGYGCSQLSNVTESTIQQDLRLLIDYINVPDEEIILWGFSLGSYPTVKVAAKRNFKGVILLSPLASVYSLLEKNLSAYSSFKNDCFNLIGHITDISSFLVIIHSKDDEIIPFKHSKVLFEKYQIMNSNPFCFLFQITGLKHNQAHALICNRNRNQIRDAFHSYLRLIIQHNSLPRVKVFQLRKQKYFNNLGQFQSAQRKDRSDYRVNEVQLKQSDEVNERQVGQYGLIDDEACEKMILTSQLFVKSQRLQQYFKVSNESNEQTQQDIE